METTIKALAKLGGGHQKIRIKKINKWMNEWMNEWMIIIIKKT